MKHLIALIAVSVHRDITTTIAVSCPEHEIPLLQSVHGEDNIFVGEPTGDCAGFDPETEHQRLSDKYGSDALRDAYGVSARGDIRRSIEKNSQGEYAEENTGIVLEGPDSKPATPKSVKVAATQPDGATALPDGKPTAQWSKAQLAEYAFAEGVDFDEADTKAVILAAINAASTGMAG